MSIPENPNNRKEVFLAAIAGQDDLKIPDDPRNREELYLKAIAEKEIFPEEGNVGDVLKKTVTGTEWGQAGGGSLPYDFLITYNYDGEYTVDKTYEEIAAAVSAGKKICAVVCSYDTYVQYVNVFETDYGFEASQANLSYGRDYIDISVTRLRLTPNNELTADFSDVVVRN